MNGGVVGLDVSFLPWDAVASEYVLKLSRIRWSSLDVIGPRFGDDGHAEEDWPEAKGDWFAGQPWTLRMSADV